jgi:hypothetical protein
MGAPHDEPLDLSRLLEEPAPGSNSGERGRATDNGILALLEANARLRALAIQLSNLVGDLPAPTEVRKPFVFADGPVSDPPNLVLVRGTDS